MVIKSKKKVDLLYVHSQVNKLYQFFEQGPVVRKPIINANPRLKVDGGFQLPREQCF